MELAGHKCVGFCEFDKFAVASYTSMHLITQKQKSYLETLPIKKRQKEILKDEYKNGEWYASDIRKVRSEYLPKADCWCFGAPCQDFSTAGKRAGLDGDRSSLIREIFRLLEEQEEKDRPEWLIYENVKGMLSSNRGLDYLSILSEMDRLGYDIEWQNINSKWFVPQNRERIYTIGHLRRFGRAKILPVTGADGENSVSIIGHKDGYRRNTQVFYPDGITETLDTGECGGRGHHVALPCFIDMNYGAGIKTTEISRTLQARYNKGINNYHGETSGVAIKIIGEVNSSQDGQIHDINGISKCHSAGHNNSPKIALPLGLRQKSFEVLGGIYTNSSQKYNSGVLNGASRTLKADSHPAGIALGIVDPQGRTKREVELKDTCPTLRSEAHGNMPDVCINISGESQKHENGIYVEMPEGFIVYAAWYEKEQCYIVIRKLTPKECFRLQGWTDDYFEKAAFVNSDSQLYKQAGNGVTVSVVLAVAEKLKK